MLPDTSKTNCALPKTKKSRLKIGGWEMILYFWDGPCSGATNVFSEMGYGAFNNQEWQRLGREGFAGSPERFCVLKSWRRELSIILLMNTLPETNSLHLKMDGWNTMEYYLVSFWEGLFSGAILVSRRVMNNSFPIEDSSLGDDDNQH